MNTFQEYQEAAVKTPLSLRNNRDRINLPLLGLQQETGKIGSLLEIALASGRLELTKEQTAELQDGLSDILWCIAVLCNESGIPMQNVAAHSLAQLQERATRLDSHQR